jgi:hypothetical protein
MNGTGTTGPIAAAANDAAMGPDVDLQDEGILGAGEVGERLTAPRAKALLGGQDVVLGDGGEVGVIASLGPGLTGSLAARPPWRRVGVGRIRDGRCGGRGGLGLAAEELLLAESEQGLKSVDLGLELGLAFEGAAMHGPPVGGLSPRLELLLQARANRTGTLRQSRGGTDRNDGRSGCGRTSTRPAQFRDRDAYGSEIEYRGRPVVHVGRI